MKTIARYLLLLPLLAVLLPGCSNPAGTDAAATSGASLADKAGAGILELEGQAMEVDAAQAAEMLPLWQALLTLSTDSNTTPEEITALNRQIALALNSEQAEAINAMNLDDAAMSGLMQKYSASSIQTAAAGGAGSQASGPAGGAEMGAGIPDGGAPMDGGGMMMAAAGSNSQAAASHADIPGQSEREEAGGKNLVFARAVIELLESKINPA